MHAVPSDVTEDDIKACIVAAEGQTLDAEERFTFFADNLPDFAMPRNVEVVPALPKNAVSRVMKHVLREQGITANTWDLQELGLSLPRSARR